MTAPFPGHSVVLHVGPTACPGSTRSLSPSHLAVGRPWTLCQQDLTLVAEGKAWEVQCCF